MRRVNILLGQLARALMLVGAVLAIVGLFAPWWLVYTAFGGDALGDTPGEQEVRLWTLMLHGGPATLGASGPPWGGPSPYVALGCFLPVATLVASSVAFVFIRAPRVRANLRTLALILAIGCLAGALLLLAVLPVGFELSDYDVQGVEYGAFAAIAGFVCIVAGILGYHF
jgi:hypothetical protein